MKRTALLLIAGCAAAMRLDYVLAQRDGSRVGGVGFGDRFSVVGRIERSDRYPECWFLRIDNDHQLLVDDLPSEIQTSGLPVVATLRFSSEIQESGCPASDNTFHIVETIAWADAPIRPPAELVSYYDSVRSVLREAGIRNVAVVENLHVRISLFDSIDPALLNLLRRDAPYALGRYTENASSGTHVLMLWPPLPSGQAGESSFDKND